jgi:hypothetical protein
MSSKSPLARTGRKSKESPKDHPADTRFGRKPAWSVIGPGDDKIISRKADHLYKSDLDLQNTHTGTKERLYLHEPIEILALPKHTPASPPQNQRGPLNKEHLLAAEFSLHGVSHHHGADRHGCAPNTCIPIEDHHRAVSELEKKLRKCHGEMEALRHKCDGLESLNDEMATHIRKLNQSMSLGAHSHVVFASPEAKIKTVLMSDTDEDMQTIMRIPVLKDINQTRFLPCTWFVAFCRRAEEILGDMSMSEDRDHGGKSSSRSSSAAGKPSSSRDSNKQHTRRSDSSKGAVDDDADLAASMLLANARVLGMELWSLRKVFAEQRKQMYALEPEHKLAKVQLDDLSRQREVEAAAHAEIMMIMSTRMQNLETTLSSFAHHQADHVTRMLKRIDAHVPDMLNRALQAGVNVPEEESLNLSPKFGSDSDVYGYKKVHLEDLQDVLAANLKQVAERHAELLRERHTLTDATKTARDDMEAMEQLLQNARAERDALRDQVRSMEESHKAAMQRATQRADEKVKAAALASFERDAQSDQMVFTAIEVLVQGVMEARQRLSLLNAVSKVKDMLMQSYRHVVHDAISSSSSGAIHDNAHSHNKNPQNSRTSGQIYDDNSRGHNASNPPSTRQNNGQTNKSSKAASQWRIAIYAVIAYGRLWRLHAQRARSRYAKQRAFASIQALSVLKERLSAIDTHVWGHADVCTALLPTGPDALFDQPQLTYGWVLRRDNEKNVKNGLNAYPNSDGGLENEDVLAIRRLRLRIGGNTRDIDQRIDVNDHKKGMPSGVMGGPGGDFSEYLRATRRAESTLLLQSERSDVYTDDSSVFDDSSQILSLSFGAVWDWSGVFRAIRSLMVQLRDTK